MLHAFRDHLWRSSDASLPALGEINGAPGEIPFDLFMTLPGLKQLLATGYDGGSALAGFGQAAGQRIRADAGINTSSWSILARWDATNCRNFPAVSSRQAQTHPSYARSSLVAPADLPAPELLVLAGKRTRMNSLMKWWPVLRASSGTSCRASGWRRDGYDPITDAIEMSGGRRSLKIHGQPRWPCRRAAVQPSLCPPAGTANFSSERRRSDLPVRERQEVQEMLRSGLTMAADGRQD
jgi:hypothetical protein